MHPMAIARIGRAPSAGGLQSPILRPVRAHPMPWTLPKNNWHARGAAAYALGMTVCSSARHPLNRPTESSGTAINGATLRTGRESLNTQRLTLRQIMKELSNRVQPAAQRSGWNPCERLTAEL